MNLKKLLNKTTITYTAILVVIFVTFFVMGRYAEAGEARIGLGAGTFNAQGAIVQDVMVTTDDLRWYASFQRAGGDDVFYNLEQRHCRTVRVPFSSVNRFAVGYRVNWYRERTVSPYLRLGAAYFDREPMPFISDDLSYDMAVGVRISDIIEIEAQHNSTAGRSAFNKGMDSVVFGVTLPFGRE